ncbi:MAG: T9SS type A sorting domain-containing protein [Prevotellaceae bacterium]|jgi:hypothetical protein|nr:T9SS type A sorting domain-containing protein [Prevotellaceae bacterium]
MKRITLLLGILSLLFGSVFSQTDSTGIVYGCKDSSAVNYDPMADRHDQSLCKYAGGNDSIAVVYGCKDSSAVNYDPMADRHDQSLCKYAGGNDSIAVVYGCKDSSAVNYDPIADRHDQSMCKYPTYGCPDSSAINFDPTADYADWNMCIYPVYGCTDRYAENYNRLANVNDSSCIYKRLDAPVTGCMDNTALNYNPLATVLDDAACVYPQPEPQPVYGCTDHKALNFNMNATDYQEGSCLYAEEENTYNEPIAETPVDTVGVQPKETCDITAGLPILSAVISSVTPTGANSVVAHWEIMQEGNPPVEYDVEYTVNSSGSVLFYLSVICKESLRAAGDAGVTGHTLSAAAEVRLTSGIYQPQGDVAATVTVYPNPSTGMLYIKTADGVTPVLKLYSLQGAKLFETQSNEMNLSAYPQGLYLLKVNGETMKIMKQ